MTLTEHQTATAVVTAAPSGWYPNGGKRMIDLVVVIPVLLLAVPVLVTATLLLRITLGRGVVLKQQRVGLHGRPFSMYKLRTMEHTRRVSESATWDGHDRRTTHKSAADPRHTTLGRTLRKFSIDELPQLVNVLRGDMSLVGPRPQLVDLASDTFRGHIRHQVRPGLTGPFQVSPLRSLGDLDAGLAIDASYVEHLTLRSDLSFLVGTVAALVRGTGE